MSHRLDDVIPKLGGHGEGEPQTLRRLLAVLAGLHAKAALVLADGPFSGLSETHAACVRRRLQALTSRCMVVVVTQHRQECAALGGHTALLAGGVIQQFALTDADFAIPIADAGKT